MKVVRMRSYIHVLGGCTGQYQVAMYVLLNSVPNVWFVVRIFFF